MQVLLKKSTTKADVLCTVCGQGFRLYWERTSAAERATMRAIVLGELREQHESDQTAEAHPAAEFNLPSWAGAPEFSAAALLGGLSGVRRTVSVDPDQRKRTR